MRYLYKTSALLISLLLGCVLSVSADTHELELALQDSKAVTAKLLPALLNDALRQRGLDALDLRYPPVPKTYVGTSKVPCPLKPWHKESTRFWVEAYDIKGSIGAQEDSFSLEVGRNQSGKPLADFRMDLPAQVHAKIRMISKSDCWSARTVFKVRFTGLKAELRSSLGVQNGDLVLLDRHAVKMSFRDIKVRMIGGDLGGIIMENLISAVRHIGVGSGSLASYFEATIIKTLSDQEQMTSIAGAIVDAANGAIAGSLSFAEQAELFNQRFDLDLALSKVLENEQVLSTIWSIDVDGPEPHRCAEALRYEPRAARAGDIAPERDEAADFNLTVPNSLIEDAFTQTIRAGAYCGYGFQMPYQCGTPALEREVNWCFGVGGVQDENDCVSVGLPGGNPIDFEREGPWVEVEFGGRVELKRTANRFGQVRPQLALPVRLNFSAEGLPEMSVLLRADIGFRIQFNQENQLELVADAQASEIVFIQGKEQVEELMCDRAGALDELARNTIWGLVGAMTLNPITLLTELDLPLEAAQLQLLDSLSFGDRAINLPFELNCAGGSCAPEIRTVADCGSTGTYNEEEMRCHYEVNAVCDFMGVLGGQQGVHYLIDEIAAWDICEQGQQQQVVSCSPGGEYSVRIGRDKCMHSYTPNLYFKEVE